MITFGGEAVLADDFDHHVHDFALLTSWVTTAWMLVVEQLPDTSVTNIYRLGLSGYAIA
jgi:hypothetical protein